MKANEAPEKIILSADRETGILYDEWVVKDLTDNIKIEYTRTDAFIEKAWNWIEDNLLSLNQQYKSHLYFKQFQNYMKGE